MKCPNELGTYKGNVYLEFPKHMMKKHGGFYDTTTGCGIDACLVEEIKYLWSQGISTYGCCCGHGIVEGMINVDGKDVPKMNELGYELLELQKDMYPYTFKTKSKHVGG